jgi:hypothetical protein
MSTRQRPPQPDDRPSDWWGKRDARGRFIPRQVTAPARTYRFGDALFAIAMEVFLQTTPCTPIHIDDAGERLDYPDAIDVNWSDGTGRYEKRPELGR